MSGKAGMIKRAACQAPACRPVPSSPPPPAHAEQTRQRSDGHAANGHNAGLDAYVARLVDAAPPLTSEQRDKLALILRGQHRR